MMLACPDQSCGKCFSQKNDYIKMNTAAIPPNHLYKIPIYASFCKKLRICRRSLVNFCKNTLSGFEFFVKEAIKIFIIMK